MRFCKRHALYRECNNDRQFHIEYPKRPGQILHTETRFPLPAIQNRWDVEFPFSVAAPSFVLPAGAAENALFLADLFPEIGLLFFEADACLAYTEIDLPPTLAELPVSWHVHMPLDFDWSTGLDAVWRKIDGLIDKAAFLSPHAYVLHPPEAPDTLVPLAARLRDKGVDPRLFSD